MQLDIFSYICCMAKYIDKQIFNGEEYYLYTGERYFQARKKRMHRVVWEFYNGKIPKGYHIHHKDGNTHNNEISNLCLVSQKLHCRYEGKKRYKNGELDKFIYAGIEAAKEWHSSEDGIKWHSEHGKKTWLKREYFDKVCEVCGNNYKTPFPNRSKYCHQNCKAKALRNRRKNN